LFKGTYSRYLPVSAQDCYLMTNSTLGYLPIAAVPNADSLAGTGLAPPAGRIQALNY
jgi:hypothetical protein